MSVCAWPVDWSCLPDLTELHPGDPPTGGTIGLIPGLVIPGHVQLAIPGDQSGIDTPEYQDWLARAQAYVTLANQVKDATDAAVMVLWSLTGQRFSCEQHLTRPCPRCTSGCSGGGVVTPMLIGGGWVNRITEQHRCTPNGCTSLMLPHNIIRVDSVQVGADVLAADQYRLEGRWLHLLGGATWPQQNLSTPLGEDGAWSITYTAGSPPPAGAAAAVGALAKELLAACAGGPCALPRTVTSVTRQGVTITRPDPASVIAQRRTGLPAVDLWITAVSPGDGGPPPRVYSPDTDNLAPTYVLGEVHL